VNHLQKDKLSDLLKLLGIRTTEIITFDVSIEDLPCSPSFIREINEAIKDSEIVSFILGPTKERYWIFKRDGDLIAQRLATMHEAENGEMIPVTLSQESDGTIRVIDLFPAFFELMESSSTSVFLIDELDRNLHPSLTSAWLSEYLDQCGKETRMQLLFTAHDPFLMEQRLFRRDEMWLINRNYHGASTLYSLNGFADLRHDKSLYRDYLIGRFGGVPDIRFLKI
jgi:AAA15 family ATPase/GTPase